MTIQKSMEEFLFDKGYVVVEMSTMSELKKQFPRYISISEELANELGQPILADSPVPLTQSAIDYIRKIEACHDVSMVTDILMQLTLEVVMLSAEYQQTYGGPTPVVPDLVEKVKEDISSRLLPSYERAVRRALIKSC